MFNDSTGLLGKMPAHGDFIKHNVSGPSWRTLDEWMQHGLYHAKQEPQYTHEYLAGDGYAFLFSPRSNTTPLVGYIHPSKDTIGREFPLLAAFELEQKEFQWGHTQDVPRRWDSYFRTAQQLIGQAALGEIDRHAVIQGLEQIHGEGPAMPDIHGVTVEQFKELHGGNADPDRMYLTFLNLIDLVAPLKGNVPDQYTLGFRFPAVLESRLAGAFASFWLEAVEYVLGGVEVSPTLFWRLPEQGREVKSSVVIFFRQPSPKVFMDILPVERDSDHICDMDLINEHKKGQAAALLPDIVKAALQSSNASLADVLEALR